MQFYKSKVLPFLGFIVLVFFIALSYFNDSIFLKEILVCSIIISMVLFVKMRGEVRSSRSASRQNQFSDAA